MKTKQICALLLACTMVVGALAGCGQKETDEQKSSESSSVEESQAEESSSVEESQEEELEPITFTCLVPATTFTLGDGIHTDEVPTLQWVYEQTGVELDFVTYDQDKYTVLAAGGDLPDIVVVDYSMGPTLIESEQLIPLEDLIDEYGHNIRYNLNEAIEASRVVLGGGEHIYTLPIRVKDVEDYPGRAGQSGLRTHYQVYKAVGSPEINTFEDVIDTMVAMQEYQREAMGSDDIWALGMCGPDATTWEGSVGMLSYGYQNAWLYGSMPHTETGELTHCFTDPESPFWDIYELYNMAWKAEVLDPESFTHSIGEWVEKLKYGENLSGLLWENPVDTATLGEDALFTWLPGSYFPYLEGVYGYANPLGNGPGVASRAISANCEDPERALQFIDFLESPVAQRAFACGVPGVHWDYDENGEPQWIGELADAYAQDLTTGNEKLQELTKLTASGIAWLVSHPTLLEDGYGPGIGNGQITLIEGAAPADKAFAQDYDPSFAYAGQVYEKFVQEGKVKTTTSAFGSVVAGYTGIPSEEAQQIANEATNYFSANFANLVMAEDYEAAKADMIQGMIDLGMDKVDAEMDALVADAIAIAKDMGIE